MTQFIATVRFAFTLSALDDGAAALRRLQEAALAAGFEMRDAAISPAPPARPAESSRRFVPASRTASGSAAGARAGGH